MAEFAEPPMSRDQLVLFPDKLDNSIGSGAPVRLLDAILDRLDWKEWESGYNLVRGQPPIHPRVIAGVILYGLLKGIRSTRLLEEAIQYRIDFRWLVQGRSIDHTTISKFRTKHAEQIRDLYVKIAVIAQETGDLSLNTLGFDGTRIRANNRRSATRSPEALRKAKKELGEKYDELNASISKLDEEDAKRLGESNLAEWRKELENVEQRTKRIDKVLAELDRLEKEKLKVPNKLPTTDPHCRVMPNKEGGFAANYTPTATVDIDSGLIVHAEVITSTEEDKYLISSVNEVVESFGLEKPPAQVLADGMMSTGENLAACESLRINLYSPIKLDVEDNPAIRNDLSQPVAVKDIDRLPITTTNHKDGTNSKHFSKTAFVYNEEKDSYWCPAGKELPYKNQTSQTDGGRLRVRRRYYANPQDCAACPLRSRCIKGPAKSRTINHEQNELLRIAHAKKMSGEEAKKIYEKRRHAGERPFAMIKNHFGARQFLTRSLTKVKTEWHWLVAAFNIHRLMGLIRSKTGPPHVGGRASCISPSTVPLTPNLQTL